jgi:hypothetical protein
MAPIKKQPMPKKPKPSSPGRMFPGGPSGPVKKKPVAPGEKRYTIMPVKPRKKK